MKDSLPSSRAEPDDPDPAAWFACTGGGVVWLVREVLPCLSDRVDLVLLPCLRVALTDDDEDRGLYSAFTPSSDVGGESFGDSSLVAWEEDTDVRRVDGPESEGVEVDHCALVEVFIDLRRSDEDEEDGVVEVVDDLRELRERGRE